MQHQKSRNLSLFFGFLKVWPIFLLYIQLQTRITNNNFHILIQNAKRAKFYVDSCMTWEHPHPYTPFFIFPSVFWNIPGFFFLNELSIFTRLTLTMLTIRRINVSVVPYVHLNLMKAYCEIKHEVKMWESESQAMSHWCTQEKFARLWLNQGSESCRSSMKRWRGNAFCWTRSVWALVQIIKFNSQYCHWQGA